MPGVKSLEAQQYYAHPQNAFWKIIGALFDSPTETYAQRVNILKSNGIALWDVLKSCERPGSLDSAINRDTEEPNDFKSFFKKHPKINRVFFNGGKAQAAFNKHVMKTLPEDIRTRLSFAALPSTSPANASIPMKKKLAAWKEVRP